MLTRLKVKGFKNLYDIDIRFGLFTCIAGPNGVGKSNLFDAILFLSDLASMPIIKAAGKARGTNGRISDFSNLFFQGGTQNTDVIEFIAEMIVPGKITDDFDREGQPRATLLEYSLTLKLLRTGDSLREPIVIEKEELRAKSASAMRKVFDEILTPEQAEKFIFGPGSRNTPFIETVDIASDEPKIKLWGDGKQNSGRTPSFAARKTPQTILSGVNSTTHPTVLAARREMQSWKLLQLEPTALRKHDNYGDDPHISSIGEHLPATLVRLKSNEDVALSLSELLPEIVAVDVDADNTRQAYTLSVTMKDKNRYAASSLSDGTLRFLALSILSTDPEATGLLCMEEPENGIHPLLIPQMLDLVRSLSDVLDSGDGSSIALRQVIINTHSPLVVAELPDDSLLMAEPIRHKGSTYIAFRCLSDTWRTRDTGNSSPPPPLGKGHLLRYLRGDLWQYIGGQSSMHAAKAKSGQSIKERIAIEQQPGLFSP